MLRTLLLLLYVIRYILCKIFTRYQQSLKHVAYSYWQISWLILKVYINIGIETPITYLFDSPMLGKCNKSIPDTKQAPIKLLASSAY